MSHLLHAAAQGFEGKQLYIPDRHDSTFLRKVIFYRRISASENEMRNIACLIDNPFEKGDGRDLHGDIKFTDLRYTEEFPVEREQVSFASGICSTGWGGITGLFPL